MLTEDLERLRESADLLLEVNLGATAVGTGLNAPVGTPTSPSGTSRRSRGTTS